MLVKGYLDKKGVIVPKLKFYKNLPGGEWVCSFLTRHKSELSMMMCQNIKRSRAAEMLQAINEFFNNFSVTIQGIPVAKVINFDETNLADDPSCSKIIAKHG